MAFRPCAVAQYLVLLAFLTNVFTYTAYAGDCFALIYTPTFMKKWIHINTKCQTTADCVNVCDCEAVCINTQSGCNVSLPPSCGSMSKETCFDVFCPYLHANGTRCGVCPSGTPAAGTCSSNCSRASAVSARYSAEDTLTDIRARLDISGSKISDHTHAIRTPSLQ